MGFKEAFRKTSVTEADKRNMLLHQKNPHWTHKKEAIGLAAVTAGEGVLSVMDKLPGEADVKIIGATAALSALAYTKRKLEVWDLQITKNYTTYTQAPSIFHNYDPQVYPNDKVTASSPKTSFLGRLLGTGEVKLDTPTDPGNIMNVRYVKRPDRVIEIIKKSQTDLDDRSNDRIKHPTPTDVWSAKQLAEEGEIPFELFEYTRDRLVEQFQQVREDASQPDEIEEIIEEESTKTNMRDRIRKSSVFSTMLGKDSKRRAADDKTVPLHVEDIPTETSPAAEDPDTVEIPVVSDQTSPQHETKQQGFTTHQRAWRPEDDPNGWKDAQQ